MTTTPSDAVSETTEPVTDLFPPEPNKEAPKKTRKPRSKSKYVAIKASALVEMECVAGSSIKEVEAKLEKEKTKGDMVILCVRRWLNGTVEEVYTLKAKRE